MTNPLRSILDICEEENFSQLLLGNVYCSLTRTRRIDCEFMSRNKDANGLYPCLNPLYQNEISRYEN